MTEHTLVFPFITKATNEAEELSYDAELALVVCLAELMRKKTSFLREKAERLSQIAKVHYPFWMVQVDNCCLIIDGVNPSVYTFAFEEPVKTGIFVEELKSNSGNLKKFIEALQNQAKTAKEFASIVNLAFSSIVVDEELRRFFSEIPESRIIQSVTKPPLVPGDNDEQVALETGEIVKNSLRTILAEVKGLRYALFVLKEERDFHSKASANEIKHIEEKSEQEIAVMKPLVDRAIKKLNQKYNKTIAGFQHNIDRKVALLDRKLEKSIRKLQGYEAKKDAVKNRMDAAKKRKRSMSTSGSFTFRKYERDVEKLKKEISVITNEIDRLTKEGNNLLKQKKEEFQIAAAQEEAKLTQIKNICTTKINEKQKQIEEMIELTTKLTSVLENRIDGLNRADTLLREQVMVDWKNSDLNKLGLAAVPIYLLKYVRGEENRYSVISPITIGQDTSMLDGLKRILSLAPEPKLKTLTHPTNKRLQETINANIAERLQNNPNFRLMINKVCEVNNLIDINTFAETLNAGLDEIENNGWMTSEEASTLCKSAVGEF